MAGFVNPFQNRLFVRFLLTISQILLVIYLFGRDVAPGFFDKFNIFISKVYFNFLSIKLGIFILSLVILWQLMKDELL